MRKSVKLTVRGLGLVATCAVFAGVAQAQDSKPVSFGVMGGLSLPMGDLGDGYDSGFNLTGSAYLKPSSARFSLRGDLGYDRFAYASTTSIVSGNFSVLSFVANILFPLGADGGEGSIKPYLVGGGGLYRKTSSVEGLGTDVSGSATDPGIGVGGGLEFKLAGFSTFAEARLVNVFGDGGSTRYLPLTFGVRF